MSPATITRPGPVTAAVRIRKSVSQLTPADLAKYRGAVSAMQALNDNRGWQYYAGWHGVPNDWCQHGSLLFLPWHRSYLFHLEIGLQRAANDPTVTVPWWDWMTEKGIPKAFTKPAGKTNPLSPGKPIKPIGVPPGAGWPTKTTRHPFTGTGPGPLSPPLQGRLAWVMQPTDFAEFSRRCEMLHNNMHVWTGGTMGQVPWAAFDPLFFSHHTMVDRLWRLWQTKNPGAKPPPQLLNISLPAGNQPLFTVAEVLDVQALGYDYGASTSHAQGTI